MPPAASLMLPIVDSDGASIHLFISHRFITDRILASAGDILGDEFVYLRRSGLGGQDGNATECESFVGSWLPAGNRNGGVQRLPGPVDTFPRAPGDAVPRTFDEYAAADPSGVESFERP